MTDDQILYLAEYYGYDPPDTPVKQTTQYKQMPLPGALCFWSKPIEKDIHISDKGSNRNNAANRRLRYQGTTNQAM